MVQQVKPTYEFADKVQPGTRVFAIFRVVKVEEKAVEANKPNANVIVTLGDKKGTLKMFLKDQAFIKLIKENDHVEVLNAHAKFYNGFI